MLQSLLQLLTRGIAMLARYRELWLAIVLGVVLPCLFFMLIQAVFTTASTTITSAYRDRVSAIQDVLAQPLEKPLYDDAELQAIVNHVATQYSDIELISILKQEGDQVRTVVSTDRTLVNTRATSTDIERISLARVGVSYFYEYGINTERQWRTYRAVSQSGGSLYFVYSVHTFAARDAVLAAKLNSVYALGIFILLVVLFFAYMSARQVNYRLLYEDNKHTLQSRDVLMAAVVHELRAPLTAVRGYASMIEETPTATPEISRYASTIKLSTARLVVLISDYINAIKIQSENSLSRSSVDVPAIITNVINELMPQAKEKELLLSWRVPLEPIIINSESAYLTQIVTNIVSNAIKYTNKGSVVVDLTNKITTIEIRIKDTGFGMSAEDQKRLFSPFSRVGDAEQIKNITGSGLGMWMTKLMTEKLGGTVAVESIKGVGTHVVLRFKR